MEDLLTACFGPRDGISWKKESHPCKIISRAKAWDLIQPAMKPVPKPTLHSAVTMFQEYSAEEIDHAKDIFIESSVVITWNDFRKKQGVYLGRI